MASTLICRNVTVSGHRTSVRLEPAMWDALHELCRREGKTVHMVCSTVNDTRRESGMTAALRVYIVSYFRSAATEDGHNQAGHGSPETEAAADGRTDENTDESQVVTARAEERIYDPV